MMYQEFDSAVLPAATNYPYKQDIRHPQQEVEHKEQQLEYLQAVVVHLDMMMREVSTGQPQLMTIDSESGLQHITTNQLRDIIRRLYPEFGKGIYAAKKK